MNSSHLNKRPADDHTFVPSLGYYITLCVYVHFTQWTHLIAQTKEQFKCLLIVLCVCVCLFIFRGVQIWLKTKWLFCVKIACFTQKKKLYTQITPVRNIASGPYTVFQQKKWLSASCGWMRRLPCLWCRVVFVVDLSHLVWNFTLHAIQGVRPSGSTVYQKPCNRYAMAFKIVFQNFADQRPFDKQININCETQNSYHHLIECVCRSLPQLLNSIGIQCWKLKQTCSLA